MRRPSDLLSCDLPDALEGRLDRTEMESGEDFQFDHSGATQHRRAAARNGVNLIRVKKDEKNRPIPLQGDRQPLVRPVKPFYQVKQFQSAAQVLDRVFCDCQSPRMPSEAIKLI